MRKLMIATAAATALLAGAGVASAQTYYEGGYARPGVGVQIGPFGAGIYAQPDYGYARPYHHFYQQPDGTTENSRAFQSHRACSASRSRKARRW